MDRTPNRFGNRAATREREEPFPPVPEEKTRPWLRALFLVLFLGGAAALFYETGLLGIFAEEERMRAFLRSLGPWSFAGFIALQTVQVVAAPIPGELTGFLGGFLYGPALGVALSTVGLTLGSLAAFALSRAFGRPFIEKVVDRNTMARFDFLLHHRGAFLVFLLFLLPGFPKDYLCYIVGLGHLSTVQFLLIAVSGRVLGTVLLTLSGNYLREGRYVELVLVTGVSVVLVLAALVWREALERRFRLLHERLHRRRHEGRKGGPR